MIFASDLDQTLIYSRRALGDAFDPSALVPVETKDGDVWAYMAVQAVSLLREVADLAMFIPVTTRTVEQYRRIHLLQEVIVPSYAVTSNGGNILIDGTPDPHWNRKMMREIEDRCLPSDHVYQKFQEIASPDWVVDGRLCDEMFYSFRVQRDFVPREEVEALAAELAAEGWETSLQGRKLYFVPQVVSKGGALKQIQEWEGREIRLASGDSLLDLSLLKAATHAMVPRHGELYRQHLNGSPVSYPFTTASGVLAAVEILQVALDLLQDGRIAVAEV